MIRRPLLFVACFVVFGSLLSARTASAAFISLSAPLAGTATAGDIFDLNVTFDLNGSAATNLVGQELYIGFTGLTVVNGSYQLGSVYTPYEADVLALDGACADLGCSYPADDQFSADHYLSLVNVFAPSAPAGPGGLFSLQFIASADSPWTLNLFGDDGYGLLWDPPAQDCGGNADCDPDPAIATLPYVIVPANTSVDAGTARVGVGLTITPVTGPPVDPPPVNPNPVPEPSSLVLLGTGIAAATASVRRRLQR